MQQTLWGEKLPRRRKKKIIPLPTTAPYAVTDNDCEVLGHTLRAWDLAGCTLCTDCHVNVFCRGCVKVHPLDEHAIHIFCPRHEERTVSA